MTENLAETRALQEGFEGAKAAMERGQEELQARLDAWKVGLSYLAPLGGLWVQNLVEIHGSSVL